MSGSTRMISNGIPHANAISHICFISCKPYHSLQQFTAFLTNSPNLENMFLCFFLEGAGSTETSMPSCSVSGVVMFHRSAQNSEYRWYDLVKRAAASSELPCPSCLVPTSISRMDAERRCLLMHHTSPSYSLIIRPMSSVRIFRTSFSKV